MTKENPLELLGMGKTDRQIIDDEIQNHRIELKRWEGMLDQILTDLESCRPWLKENPNLRLEDLEPGARAVIRKHRLIISALERFE